MITSIENPDYEQICRELGLKDTIIPVRTISRFLADMLAGIDYLELRTIVKEDARLFSFQVRKEDAGVTAKLDLPNGARVVWFYRDGRFHLAGESSTLKTGDEVVIATHSKHLPAFRERWEPNSRNHGTGNR